LESLDGIEEDPQASLKDHGGRTTQDLDVPFEAIREEEQDDFEEQEDQENLDDHESEEELPTTILFILEQLEVLLKMNKFDFSELVMALKGGASKGVGFQLVKPGNFDKI
jgi:hypothetical protein